jgi:hypothetical protein
MAETVQGNTWEELEGDLKAAWVGRHEAPHPQRLIEAYLGGAIKTLQDALLTLDFYDLALGDDHEGLFALADGNLYTAHIEDNAVRVEFLGAFPGGNYVEESQIEHGQIAGGLVQLQARPSAESRDHLLVPEFRQRRRSARAFTRCASEVGYRREVDDWTPIELGLKANIAHNRIAMRMTSLLLLMAVLAIAMAPSTAAKPLMSSAASRIPPLYRSCKALNKRYPHGVGKTKAHDKTSDVPVTNFRHSNKLYRVAMSYNRGLDRDKDGIACEQL